jgi:hypothetical protein
MMVSSLGMGEGGRGGSNFNDVPVLMFFYIWYFLR